MVVVAEDALRRDLPPSSGNSTLGNHHIDLQISVQHLKILTSILRSSYPVSIKEWATMQPAKHILKMTFSLRDWDCMLAKYVLIRRLVNAHTSLQLFVVSP